MSATDPYMPPVKKRGGTSSTIKTSTTTGAFSKVTVTGPPKKIGAMSRDRSWDPLNPAQKERQNC